MNRIFIIRGNGSGTTWLTNLLASHPQVYIPQHADHCGKHESVFFSYVVSYCNFGRPEVDRRAILRIFERSDYRHLLFPNIAPKLDIEKLGVGLYFAAAIDAASRQREAIAWLEKSPAHTFVLHHIMAVCPEAKFIYVERELVDTVRSIVHKSRNPDNSMHWVKAAARTTIMPRIGSSSSAVYSVKYDDLVQNTDVLLKQLLDWLAIEGDTVSGDSWSARSSFTGARPAVLWQMRSMTLFTGFLVGFLVPSLVWRACVEPWHALRARRTGLPPWFFRVFGAASGANNVS